MKYTYPIILTPAKIGYTVHIPDFNIGTQGKSIADAIEMAIDAISLVGIDMQDDGEPLPAPSAVTSIQAADRDLILLVDVDFVAYRRNNE